MRLGNGPTPPHPLADLRECVPREFNKHVDCIFNKVMAQRSNHNFQQHPQCFLLRFLFFCRRQRLDFRALAAAGLIEKFIAKTYLIGVSIYKVVKVS